MSRPGQALLLVLGLTTGCSGGAAAPRPPGGPGIEGPPRPDARSLPPATAATGGVDPGVVDAAPAPVAAAVPAAVPAGCDLRGDYKLRFRSNGHDGWWYRVRLDGDPVRAEFLDEIFVLQDRPGPGQLEVAAAGCGFTVRSRSGLAGEVALTAQLDPGDGTFTGRLTRTRAHAADERDQVVRGVRERGASAAPACAPAGVYRLSIDPKARWRNVDPTDDRPCRGISRRMGPVLIRVEPLGPALVTTLARPEPPHAQAWSLDHTEARGPCAVALGLQDDATELAAEVTFAAGAVRGTARVDHHVVEEDEHGEDLWHCLVDGATITGRLVAPARPPVR